MRDVETVTATATATTTETATATVSATETETGVDGVRDRLGAGYHKLLASTAVSNLGDGMATVAYPWLASVVTRNPLLVALVAVAQRLPWLLFTLPAGVITDRVDRRRAMVAMDTARGLLTVVVALAVLGAQNTLPGPDAIETTEGTRWGLYAILLVATLLLGMAEVLRDNAAQTILPNVVRPEQLEKANGRLASAELVTNMLAGPPLGSILLLVALSLPFFVDATTFFLAAALVFLIPGSFRSERDETQPRPPFRQELGDGIRWLRGNTLLWPMAIILGLMNGAAMIALAPFVLFAQEVLDVGPLLFTIVFFGAAIGGIIGGPLAPRMSTHFGSGTSLAITLGGLAIVPALIGLIAWWPAVLVLFGVEAFLGIVWNVITVSFRQRIIPEHLLGRVNSVYRFFAWGMMPIGAAFGGLLIVVVENFASRDLALRSTWFAVAAVHALLFVFGRGKLTNEKIEAARLAAAERS